MLSNASVQMSLSGLYSASLDLGVAQFQTALSAGANFDSGTGAGQVDKIWTDTRTLAASGTEDIDLAGTLVDAFGAAVTFAKIKGLLVRAAPGNTNDVKLGGIANGWATFLSPAATGLITLRPGSALALCAGGADATGYTVTPGTGDLLHVANSSGGTSVTYDIAILGTSA